MKNRIEEIINESMQLRVGLYEREADNIEKAAREVIKSLKAGGKLIVFGNGGSAADSQHIAAELVGRFKKERKGLAAIALTTNTSVLSAIANDYGYDVTFTRQIEALAKPVDVALAISTSGNSKNVIEAARLAKSMGMVVIALTGASGGSLRGECDITIRAPSENTPRIQELHILIGHIICELIEDGL